MHGKGTISLSNGEKYEGTILYFSQLILILIILSHISIIFLTF